METVLDFLGFATVAGTVWNAVSYAAFIVIIIGVYSERHRNTLITLGAAVLALYAGIFLKNPLFATLQTLIVISGLLKLTKFSRRISMAAIILLTAAAYAILYGGGVITDTWSLMGSFGLLGIALGLATLPRRYGFILMAIGGLFLIAYAFQVSVWVFFLLNIFFAIANIQAWQKPESK